MKIECPSTTGNEAEADQAFLHSRPEGAQKRIKWQQHRPQDGVGRVAAPVALPLRHGVGIIMEEQVGIGCLPSGQGCST